MTAAAVRGFRYRRVHRQRAGARGGARRQGGAGLARQAHAALPGMPARFFSWARSTPICRCRSAAATQRALRQLPRLSRRLPDRRHRRALRARRAPLHLLSHHRAQGQHSRSAAAADRQSRLRLRRLPARLPVEPATRRRARSRISPCATAWTTPICSRSSPGPRPSSRRAWRAARSGASAISAGCAISPWVWAMPPYDAAIVAALEAPPRRPFGAGARARGVGARAPARRSAAPSAGGAKR